jgi:Fe2+ transport system protein FeoA
VSTKALMPLEFLQSGDWAVVGLIEGEPHWVGRLAEMGLRPGTRLRMLQSGSPCLFNVGGCRLSLRLDNAGGVFVEPLQADAISDVGPSGPPNSL